MWIRDVNFPEAVVEAHRSGRLVLFVGAGASRSAPSSLPDFRTLAGDIAAESGAPATDEQLAQPDVLLGDLAEQHHVDVHLRVAQRIGDPASLPNRLHQSVIDLAASGSPLRIVTTNYDLHLSAVLSAAGLAVDEYHAPALPMGDDFTGLVYLHGSLRKPPSSLIVTDADFGRAYLRDGWAARFLERMFATFTVLFVGYSHNDVVMSYLARGLGAATARYALTPDPESSHWRRLHIKPLAYPVVHGSHDALVEAVDGWAQRASMGLLVHRQEIARLLAGPPPEVPEEASYIESVIADPERVVFFIEHARDLAWLEWAARQPTFQRLFDPLADPGPSSAPLAYWFARHYALDAGLTAAALGVVHDRGGHLGAVLWEAIGHSIHMLPVPHPPLVGPWLGLLMQNPPQRHGDWLEYALAASRLPQDRWLALILFEHLTVPKVALQPSFGGSPWFDVETTGDVYWLQEAWRGLFVPHLGTIATDLLAIVDRQLHRAYTLLWAIGTAAPGWDPLSFSRPAIEPHPQNHVPDCIDVLINAARDCLDAMIDSAGPLAADYIDHWTTSEHSLLRRLAIYGYTKRRDIDATAKLAWLRSQHLLFEHTLFHEVLMLIATALPDASTEVATGLAADVIAEPGGPDDRVDYTKFALLSWIVRHSADLAQAVEGLEELKAAHPDFAEDGIADVVSPSGSGAVRPQPPMPPKELHEAILADANLAMSELLQYEPVSSPFSRPNWMDALDLVSSTVMEWPTDGTLALEPAMAAHRDLARAIVRGWADADPGDEAAQAIAECLLTAGVVDLLDEVCFLLSRTGSGPGGLTVWHRVSGARDLARVAWEALPASKDEPSADGWLGLAINRGPGQLAEFWLHAVSNDWRTSGDAWAGIVDGPRAALEVMLASTDGHGTLAQVVIASQLPFFFAADLDWCKTNVLPLLSWSDVDRAVRTWNGFLTWGRWNDALLTSGLLDGYVDAVRHADRFSSELRSQLVDHLAGIAVLSDVNPIESGWARSFTIAASPEDRTEWMRFVAWQMARVPSEVVERRWTDWMRSYWEDRLASVPMELTDEEASAMAHWTIYLTMSIDQGVGLAESHTAGLLPHSSLLRDISEERLRRAPASYARLVTHVLTGTAPPLYDCGAVASIVELVRQHDPTFETRPIIEQALRLGCADAAAW
jgi:hypothetical protein